MKYWGSQGYLREPPGGGRSIYRRIDYLLGPPQLIYVGGVGRQQISRRNERAAPHTCLSLPSLSVMSVCFLRWTKRKALGAGTSESSLVFVEPRDEGKR